MPKTIDQLPEVTSLDGTEELVVSQLGVTKKSLLSRVRTYLGLDDLTATAAELNKLDGATVTTAELNKLAGTPAGLTSTEIGYLDGVTSAIQTQLNTKLVSNFSESEGKVNAISNNTSGILATSSVDGVPNSHTDLQLNSSTASLIAHSNIGGIAEIILNGGGTCVLNVNAAAPANASAEGTAGEIRFDANYMYRCVATNTWKRVAIATW